MDIIGKDMVGEIFKHLTPTGWYCCSLTCKKWNKVISSWMTFRKKMFIKCLREQVDLFGLYLEEEKDRLCIRPMYYLQGVGTGCKGKVTNYLCARHRMLSVHNKDICEMCRQLPVSEKCFGNRCNSLTCRDYLYILRNGEAVKVKAYVCRYQDCFKSTDSPDGYCYNHAVSIAISEELVEKSQKYQCIAYTKKEKRCTFKTSSRLSKCHQHLFSTTSLITENI